MPLVKVLLAGLGSIGRRHLRNLLYLGVKDLVLLRSGRSTLPAEELAGFPTESDLATALERHRPDGVIVANPTSCHLKTAIPAGRAGCRLLIEKPLAEGRLGIPELIRAVEQGGASVTVGYHFRFNPGLLAIREFLNSGKLGRVISAQVSWGEYLPSWHPWEDFRISYAARGDLGGGVILTLSHPFDYLRWLLGEVSSVTAMSMASGALGITVEDTADICLRFDDGVLANVHLDYLQQPRSHWLVLTGERGLLRWDGETGSVGLHRRGEAEVFTLDPPRGFERNWMFLHELEHFLAPSEEDASPAADLNDGLAALEIALAAKESSRTGKEVCFADRRTSDRQVLSLG